MRRENSVPSHTSLRVLLCSGGNDAFQQQIACVIRASSALPLHPIHPAPPTPTLPSPPVYSIIRQDYRFIGTGEWWMVRSAPAERFFCGYATSVPSLRDWILVDIWREKITHNLQGILDACVILCQCCHWRISSLSLVVFAFPETG